MAEQLDFLPVGGGSTPASPLIVSECSHADAKHAIKSWHYLGTMPWGKCWNYGVWEYGVFVGAIVIARGANRRIGSPYGLDTYGVVELCRIGMTKHKCFVSQATSIAVRKFSKLGTDAKIIISYADPGQGHKGKIYQAMGWHYEGKTKPRPRAIMGGKCVHPKTLSDHYPSAKGRMTKEKFWKYKFSKALDKSFNSKLNGMSIKYEK